MHEAMKTSADWLQEVQKDGEIVVIMDADGWDRSNFDFSFHKELISRTEFEVRLSVSTVLMRAKPAQSTSDGAVA